MNNEKSSSSAIALAKAKPAVVLAKEGDFVTNGTSYFCSPRLQEGRFSEAGHFAGFTKKHRESYRTTLSQVIKEE